MPSSKLTTREKIRALLPLKTPNTRLTVVQAAIIDSAVSELNAPLASGRYGLFTRSSFLSYT